MSIKTIALRRQILYNVINSVRRWEFEIKNENTIQPDFIVGSNHCTVNYCSALSFCADKFASRTRSDSQKRHIRFFRRFSKLKKADLP